MCNICGSPYPCSCSQISYVNYPCTCRNTGSTHTWDSASIIYHKSLSIISALTGLNLPNGSTLQLILETIDTKIQQLNVDDWTLSFLRQTTVIHTVQEFAEKVDGLLGTMGYLGEKTSDPVLGDISNGQYWYRTDTSELKIKVDGTTRTITTT